MFILCVKSSHAMGMGHLFRTINLYRGLRQRGANAVVVLLGEHVPASEWLRSARIPFQEIKDQVAAQPGWEVGIVLRYRAKVWVNDRLHTDLDHVSCIKAMGLRLCTFDDLGSGAAMADVHVAALAMVRGENPQGAKVLVGLKFLILSPEIEHFRRQRIHHNSWVVSLGGSDTHGVTVKVAQWLSSRQQHATLILGPGFNHEDELAKVVGINFTVKRTVKSLISEFACHDLAITGGGLTAFEATAVGLPTVTVANEEWEVAHCLHLQGLGCSIFAGMHKNINWSSLEVSQDLTSMSAKALHAIDTDGIIRVSLELMALLA
jgi:spore coat polysaccharide biosynthesis predicted glycosyltransferase SpsG